MAENSAMHLKPSKHLAGKIFQASELPTWPNKRFVQMLLCCVLEWKAAMAHPYTSFGSCVHTSQFLHSNASSHYKPWKLGF